MNSFHHKTMTDVLMMVIMMYHKNSREEVQDHSVKWQQTFKFMVKMTADFSSGILDSCKLRISIRRVCCNAFVLNCND